MATRTQTEAARRKAEEVKAKSDANGQAEPTTEDTIVQVRGKDGEWTDYARTTRREALATLSGGHLPGSEREELRAVDWITKEEVKPADEKEPTTRSRKPASPKAPRKPRSGPATKAGSAEGFDPSPVLRTC